MDGHLEAPVASVQLQAGRSDKLMRSSGDCHSFPDTKAYGLQGSQRQAILLAF